MGDTQAITLIEVGKSYVASDRSAVRIVLQKQLPVPYPFVDSDGYVWSTDGRRPDKSQPHIVCASDDFARIASLAA